MSEYLVSNLSTSTTIFIRFVIYIIACSFYAGSAAANNSGLLGFTDTSGVERKAYGRGEVVYLSVTDTDRNTSGSADTLTVRVTSDTENTGTPASATSPNGSGNVGDGTLTVEGVSLDTQTERWTVTAISATEFVVSGSVSGTQSQSLFTTDSTYTTDNNEVRLSLSVGNFAFSAGDRFTFDTTAAVIVAETVTLTETGPDTGVFAGSINLSEVSSPVADNGVLEIQSGNQITALYDDPAGDFGAPAQVRTQAIYAATIIRGATLLNNTVWSVANSPYLLTGDLTVESGATLIIDPGVTVLFLANSDDTSSGDYPQDSELIINGNLVAQGTAADRITFASSRSSPAAGDWGQIRLNGMGVNFNYVDIKHASLGIRAQDQANGDTIRIANSRFELNHTVLQQSTSGTGAQIDIRNNMFTNTTNQVIEVYGNYRSGQQPNIQIIGNTATEFQGGVRISYPGSLEMTGNTFTTTQSPSGFRIESAFGTNSLISDNNISVSDGVGCGGYCTYSSALFFSGSSELVETVSLTGNAVVGGDYGMLIYPNYGVTTISDNSATGARSTGIYVSAYNNVSVTVQNNTAEDNDIFGFYLGGAINAFSGNITRRNQVGLYLQPSSDAQIITVVDNIISNNTDTGIKTDCCNAYSDITIKVINNDLSGNGNYAIYNSQSFDIDARQNWWGADETAAIESGTNPQQLDFIFDGLDSGNSSAGAVNYAGWLPSSPTSFPITAISSPLAGGTTSCSPAAVDLRGESSCIAVTNEGYAFDGWSGACSTASGFECKLANITEAQTSTAHFVTSPSAPTVISFDAGDGEIILSVGVSNDGGSDVLEYIGTCSDGESDYISTSTRPRVTVTGLTNEISYTCQAFLKNRVGLSPPSLETSPIVPEGLPGLPIWLLYEAARQARLN